MTNRVLLTGVSGFLGGHIALQLLKAGYIVRGSVRNLSKADKVRDTLRIAGADISNLEFVALDLLDDNGWEEALIDCKYLMHSASPTAVQMPKDPQVLIRPAVEGTARAVKSALNANVERIVLTSSTDAILCGHNNLTKPVTEADWTNVDDPNTSAYAKSKTLAEREAWKLVDAADRRETLAVINPALILGPLLDEDAGTSSTLVKILLAGNLPATPRLSYPLVDVRDVAALHVDALTNPVASGNRCIVSAETLPMSALGKLLKPSFPNRRIPTKDAPDWLVRVMSVFDADIRSNLFDLGKHKPVDGSQGSLRLDRSLISAGDAAIATGRSLEKFGHI